MDTLYNVINSMVKIHTETVSRCFYSCNIKTWI